MNLTLNVALTVKEILELKLILAKVADSKDLDPDVAVIIESVRERLTATMIDALRKP